MTRRRTDLYTVQKRANIEIIIHVILLSTATTKNTCGGGSGDDDAMVVVVQPETDQRTPSGPPMASTQTEVLRVGLEVFDAKL